MMDIMDKRDRSTLFRDRLLAALADKPLSQSALARAVGVNRSTITQILDPDAPRLPGGHIVGAMAEVLGVSTDWLLGLSDHPEQVQAVMAATAALQPAHRAMIDEQILGWHEEAAGYKIRHVPATLPDMLKTREMLHWEYAPHLGRTPQEAMTQGAARLDKMRSGQSDFEIALPQDALISFARGTGYYDGLPVAIRAAQIEHLIDICQTHYPSLRVTLFDARQVFSAPLTVFGPLLAVLYVGSHHIVFRDRDRLRAITQHFDGLVRAATVPARDLPDWLRALWKTPENHT